MWILVRRGSPERVRAGAKVQRKVKSPMPGEERALTDCFAQPQAASVLPSIQQQFALSQCKPAGTSPLGWLVALSPRGSICHRQYCVGELDLPCVI